MPRVAINIVTYNSEAIIDACLTSVFRQDYTDYHVTVIDNASQDGTLDILRQWEDRGVEVLTNAVNLYYSRAHNYGIRETASEFVLTLNPDVILRPDFLRRVVEEFDVLPRVGSINGKLLLLDSDQVTYDSLAAMPIDSMLIDSAGLMLYRSRRPFLRGNRRPAGEACREPATIFGVDGACAAYRRSMLNELTVEAEYFDNDFVIYREDVDLAWRAQIYGWDARYVPDAVGFHVRGFHPGQDRRSIPTHLKRQSVKNGWLLLIKNDTPASVARDARWIVPYQLKVIAGLLTIERTSLGAIIDLLKLLPRMWDKRREIQEKRRRTDAEIEQWLD